MQRMFIAATHPSGTIYLTHYTL